jgi:hypothetical protein
MTQNSLTANDHQPTSQATNQCQLFSIYKRVRMLRYFIMWDSGLRFKVLMASMSIQNPRNTVCSREVRSHCSVIISAQSGVQECSIPVTVGPGLRDERPGFVSLRQNFSPLLNAQTGFETYSASYGVGIQLVLAGVVRLEPEACHSSPCTSSTPPYFSAPHGAKFSEHQWQCCSMWQL